MSKNFYTGLAEIRDDYQKDERVARYLSKQAVEYSPNLSIPRSLSSTRSWRKVVDKFLDSFSDKDSERIDSWQDKALDELINEGDFYWLKNDQRSCNFIWSILKVFDHNALVSTLNSQCISTEDSHTSLNPHSISIFSTRVLESHPFSAENRLDEIIEYLDYHQPISGTSDDKSARLHALQLTAESVQHDFPNPLPWLEASNEDQVSWALAYTYVYGKDKPRKEYKRTPISEDETDFPFKAVSSQEKYSQLIAAFDIWDAPIEAKELYHAKISRAWSQKKFRSSQKDRVSLNTLISPKHKKYLKHIAVQTKRTQYEVLEDLISKEYDQVKFNR